MEPTVEQLKQQLVLERAAKQGADIAEAWRWKHRHEFESSNRNTAVLASFLNARGLPVSEENLDLAFEWCRKHGHDFSDPLEEGQLPPLPVGMPDIRTRKDIDRLSADVYSKHHRGPHGKEWQARVNAILKAGI
jgi:hypothetical protein